MRGARDDDAQDSHDKGQTKERAQGRKRRTDAPDNPTSEQMASRAKSRDAAMEARSKSECRSHLKGRCINGAKCTAKHTTPCSEILCNSRVPIGSVANFTNLSYGYCRLDLAEVVSIDFSASTHGRPPPSVVEQGVRAFTKTMASGSRRR